MEINYDKLPEHMRYGAKLYIEQGILTGSFLTAVLENDLKGAFQCADSTNGERLKDWVEWMAWEIPAIAHGSPEQVKAWMSHKGLEGLD